MTSHQAVEFADFFADLRYRSSNPDLDLATVRDIAETMHLATKEPEDVTYAEVDAGGVEALWCIPAHSDPDAVLLHNHIGGGVLTSMHSNRDAAARQGSSPARRDLADFAMVRHLVVQRLHREQTPIRTSCSHVRYWSSFAPRGSTAPAWSRTTRGESACGRPDRTPADRGLLWRLRPVGGRRIRVPEVDEAIDAMGIWLRQKLGLGPRRAPAESPDLEASA
jgi:hypothetical protein